MLPAPAPQPLHDHASTSLHDLCKIFLATVVDAKDFIAHLETTFCKQLWPTFCSEIAECRGRVMELETYIDERESERTRLVGESDALRLELEREKLRFDSACEQAERCGREAGEKEKNEICEKLQKFEKENQALEQRLERLRQDNLIHEKQRQRLEDTVRQLQEAEKLALVKEMLLREENQTLTMSRAACEKSQALKVRRLTIKEREKPPQHKSPCFLQAIEDKCPVDEEDAAHKHLQVSAEKNLVQSLSDLQTHQNLQERNNRPSEGLNLVSSDGKIEEQTLKRIVMDPEINEKIRMDPDADERTCIDPEATQDEKHIDPEATYDDKLKDPEATQDGKHMDSEATQEFKLIDSEATKEGTHMDPRVVCDGGMVKDPSAVSGGHANLGSSGACAGGEVVMVKDPKLPSAVSCGLVNVGSSGGRVAGEIVEDSDTESSCSLDVVDKISAFPISCEQAPKIRATSAAEPTELVSGRDCRNRTRVEQKRWSGVSNPGTLISDRPAPSSTIIHRLGNRSRGHSWRKTRTRAEPFEGDPHDSFLDTPRETVLAQLAANRNQEGFKKTSPGTKSALVSPGIVSGAAVTTVSSRHELVSDILEGTSVGKAALGISEHLTTDPRNTGGQDRVQRGTKIALKGNKSSGPGRSQKKALASKAPSFKFNTATRKKRDRELLPATDCKQCREFYDAVASHDVNGVMMFRCERHDVSSRHRFQYLPPATPKGFWQIDFDSNS